MSVLPFYFYYADPTETTFDASTMNVFAEEVFSFKINHEEGQIPTLDITIRNPRIGLLNPSRKQWAWLSWQSDASDPTYHGAIVPLFFGRLVGLPTNLFKELITLQFIARSPTFISDKQAVAETMKTAPNYDPLWLDESKRDDPDAILEGWSALWHIDRLTNQITASDVLSGEDGTVVFDASKAFYDSVGVNIGQPPLVNVRVEASVKWTQRFSGYITDIPPVHLASYTGDSFLSDWPKPGVSVGGGYRVQTSFVTDIYHVAQTPTTSYTSSWTASDNPGQCGTESASSSSSGPALLSPNPLSCILTSYFKTGVCFPDSDPPTNTPAETKGTGMIVPAWYLTCNMTLRYDASREFSEDLSFDMVANVQDILTSPQIDQNTELLKLTSVDLGAPLENVLGWTNFRGQHVGLAQIIWPNNPTKPGGLAYQICISAGTAGSVEPVFSDIPGTITTDNTVTWASLGDGGLSITNGWNPGQGVPYGQIMLIQEQEFNPATGEMEDVPGSSAYYICIGAGTTNDALTKITYVPPVSSNDEPTPEKITVNIFTPPDFTTGVGVTIGDGSVEWMGLGKNPSTMAIPIGGTPDTVTARHFFPTPRGRASLEYLICRARARLRYRARALTVTWQSKFQDCVGLSCRMNAALEDPRLPGGEAIGKITAYNLEVNGSTGELRGTVTIGVPIGLAGSVVPGTGVPEYAAAGYAQTGWQRYDGATIVLPNNDISYTPPAGNLFDDGLSYPLSWKQISDGGVFSGSLATQAPVITAAFATAIRLQYIQAWAGATISTGNTNSTQSGLTPDEAWKLEEEELALASSNVPYVMEANPVAWTCLLKPCANNGPFIGAYAISVSPLEIEKGIDLSAPSNL